MWSGKVTYSRSLRHSTLQICSIKRLHDCGPLIINMDMALPWISSIGIFSYFLLRYECKCKTFNNSILGAGLFKRSAPSGFTSSPLKEEISLYSIIRSKWFERVIFPPPSSCHPKCGRKWQSTQQLRKLGESLVYFEKYSSLEHDFQVLVALEALRYSE